MELSASLEIQFDQDAIGAMISSSDPKFLDIDDPKSFLIGPLSEFLVVPMNK